VPHASVAVLPTGHNVQEEQPAALAAIVAERAGKE
jgi:pimeloyl-ACP methyl ester carboxylesterase